MNLLPLCSPPKTKNGHCRGYQTRLLHVEWPVTNRMTSFCSGHVSPDRPSDGYRKQGPGRWKALLPRPLVPQKTVGEWTLCGHLGYWIQTAKEFSRIFGMGRRPSMDATSAGAGGETVHQSTTNVGDPCDTGFNLGGTLKVSKGYNLLLFGWPEPALQYRPTVLYGLVARGLDQWERK